MKIKGLILAMALCSTITMGAQGAGKFVPFKYGNMDQWVTRSIKESGIIGGNQKTLYEVGPNMSLSGNNPYTNKGGSPWGNLQCPGSCIRYLQDQLFCIS